MSNVEVDPDLTPEQEKRVSELSATEIDLIDEALNAMITKTLRKMARVVGGAMMDERVSSISGVPDIFYAKRVHSFISNGEVEFVGNLRCMRQCEVRRR